jgi:hypothetical protein
MEAFSFINNIPAWVPSAAIAGVLLIAAIIFYFIGIAQGYTSEDYRRARQRRRRRRRR